MQKSKPIKVGDLVRLKPSLFGDLDPKGVTALGWTAVVLELLMPRQRHVRKPQQSFKEPSMAYIQWPNNFIQRVQVNRLENISGRVSIT